MEGLITVLLTITMGVCGFILVVSAIAMKLTLKAKEEADNTLKSIRLYEKARRLNKQNNMRNRYKNNKKLEVRK